jgi:hypothetical protein
MWGAQKTIGHSQLVKSFSVDGYYTHEDGRSMSSSALPLSTTVLKRARAATSEVYYRSGGRTVASSASLPLHSDRSNRDDRVPKVEEEEEEPVAVRKLGQGSMMSTMKIAEMEEVIPWELQPLPILAGEEGEQNTVCIF